jgi:RNA polymerase sigma-70 factor (ECF subfamily)
VTSCESSLPQSGSQAEFEQFYRAEQANLLKFLIYRGAHPADAADASQHAWVEVYRRWDRVSHMAYPGAYIRQIASNEWKRLNSRPQQDRDRAAQGGWIDLAAVEDIYDKEDVKTVLEILATLPERQREVMAWLYDGYSSQEIAERLKMQPSTVRSTIRHARSTLIRGLGLGEEG